MTCYEPTVAPPDTAVWYDLETVVDAVLGVLRLTEQDVDRARVETIVPAAAGHIDQFLDRPLALNGPPPSPAVRQALQKLTIQMYRGDPPSFEAEPDVLAAIRSEILADKQRWGLA